MAKETLPASIHDRKHDSESEYTHMIDRGVEHTGEANEFIKQKDPREQQETLDNARNLAAEADQQRITSEGEHKSPAEKRITGAPSRKKRQAAYQATLKEIRSEMSPGEKLVSGIIHNKAIEPTSNFIGATIARPNAMLSGSIAAFIAVTIVYFVAKNYGYQLSGFETIGAFIVGWLLGIIYDYVSILFNRKNK